MNTLRKGHFSFNYINEKMMKIYWQSDSVDQKTIAFSIHNKWWQTNKISLA